MTIKQAIHYISTELSKIYPSETQGTIGLWILGWATGKSHAELIGFGDQSLTQKERDRINEALTQHTKEHKPLQYIFGTVPFLSLDLLVEPPILIPRPETEEWVSWLISAIEKHTKDFSILDMCTGSGCIALSLADAFPKAQVLATDISEQACSLTLKNAQRNALSNVQCLTSDLFSSLPQGKKFDLIVSNPPYISYQEWLTLEPRVKNWEDPQALSAPDDGLKLLKDIIFQAPQWLTPKRDDLVPRLVVEIGHQQGSAVKELFLQAGFTAVSVHQDSAGKDRFVTGT